VSKGGALYRHARRRSTPRGSQRHPPRPPIGLAEAPRDAHRRLQPRATVFLNGVLVQNNAEFKGPTGIQHRDFPGQPATGPIVLQGDHDRVMFRNIWVVPLEGDRIVVIDRSSANGTYVNSVESARVSKVELKSGDTIIIARAGVARFTFQPI
jgi:hypothetical protein